jgi:hypothetical protein
METLREKAPTTNSKTWHYRYNNAHAIQITRDPFAISCLSFLLHKKRRTTLTIQ